MTCKEIGRLPAWWNDTGVFALTVKGLERYKWLIGDELPDYVSLCENGSLIATADFVDLDFDIEKIVHDAYIDLIFLDESGIWVGE